jgi:hypothetical protein
MPGRVREMDITEAAKKIREEKEAEMNRLVEILRDLDAEKKGFQGTAKKQTPTWPSEEREKGTVEIVVELRKEMPLEYCNLL